MAHEPVSAKKKRLSFRLVLFVLSSTTLIYAAAFGYNYYYSRDLVLKNVRENATNLTRSLVHRLETKLNSVEQVPRYLAVRLGHEQPVESKLVTMISDMVADNPEIFGSTVAFEPYAMVPTELYFAPYLYRDETGQVSRSELGGVDYHYFDWDWYRILRSLNQAPAVSGRYHYGNRQRQSGG